MSGGGGDLKNGPVIDLVPILDAMTAVIFFLVLSGTFIEYTKHTMPQSTTSTITNPIAPAPVAPKLFIIAMSEKLDLVLKWEGDKPGMKSYRIPRSSENNRSKMLERAVDKLTSEFKKTYPNENNIQLGLSELATYQETITVIDGIKNNIKDVVMNSYSEESMFQNIQAEEFNQLQDLESQSK